MEVGAQELSGRLLASGLDDAIGSTVEEFVIEEGVVKKETG